MQARGFIILPSIEIILNETRIHSYMSMSLRLLLSIHYIHSSSYRALLVYLYSDTFFSLYYFFLFFHITLFNGVYYELRDVVKIYLFVCIHIGITHLIHTIFSINISKILLLEKHNKISLFIIDTHFIIKHEHRNTSSSSSSS